MPKLETDMFFRGIKKPVYIIDGNGEYYKYYPKIREKDIGIDTSNLFVDTLRFSNAYLSGCGGDGF